MKKMITGFAVIFLLITVLPAFSKTPDAKSLVRDMKDVLEPSRPSVRSVDIISTDAKGEKITLSLLQANKKLPDGKRILMVVQKPVDIQGITDLYWERGNRRLPVYEYLPFMRRVKELLGVVTYYNNFFATDFTYADLGFIPVQENYKLLGEEQHNGTRAYKVEETVPKERIYDSRIITWIAADTKLPIERNYYYSDGKLWKQELFTDIAVVDGIPTPMDILMKDVLHGSTTELKVTSIRNDVTLPDELFMPENLSKAQGSPIWGELKTLNPK